MGIKSDCQVCHVSGCRSISVRPIQIIDHPPIVARIVLRLREPYAPRYVIHIDQADEFDPVVLLHTGEQHGGGNELDRIRHFTLEPMSTRGLLIGIAVLLMAGALAAVLLRSTGPANPEGSPAGTVDGGEAAFPAIDDDTLPDPTEEYIRQLERPDTSGLALLRADSAAAAAGSGPLPGPAVGAPGPSFALPTVEGQTFRLTDVRGHVAVLNFWATWCEPCRDEIPGLIVMQEDLRDAGLRVVGISIEDDGREAVSSFTEAFPFNYPLLIDGRFVAADYGADVVVPTTVVLDRRGNIAARLYGAVDRDSLEAHVRPLLARR